MNKWYKTIDGIPTFAGNVPAIAISIAQASAAITVANHAATPAAGYFPIIPFNPLKVYNPTPPPMIAMFNTFAPKAVIPPSANINAWMRSTTVKTSTAASGAKNTIATKAHPTMCPLVPNGIGMFIDMIAKIPAARTAKRGIRFSSKLDLAHFTEKYNATIKIT